MMVGPHIAGYDTAHGVMVTLIPTVVYLLPHARWRAALYLVWFMAYLSCPSIAK